MNDTIALSNVLAPYLSASSASRLTPTLTEAMAAQTSPSSTSGIRELTLMISITGRIGSPREMILIAGRRRPSWKISVGVARQRARRHAANIGIVGDVGGPRDDLPVDEDRHGDNDIVQVGDAAVIGVVGGEHVARLEVAGLVVFGDDHLHRLVEHPDKGGNTCARRGDLAARVEDAGAHVEHFVDDRTHGGFLHRREHFIGRRLQGVLDDLHRDRVIGKIGHDNSPQACK